MTNSNRVELHIHVKPLPWFSADRLRSLAVNVSKINNKLSPLGWKVLKVWTGKRADGNYDLILLLQKPRAVYAGIADIRAVILALAALILAVGALVWGWEWHDVQTKEIKYRESHDQTVRQILTSPKVPEEVKKQYGKPEVLGIGGGVSGEKQGIGGILSSLQGILMFIVVIMLLKEILPLLSGFIGRVRA